MDFTVAVEEFGETRVGETEFQIFVSVLLDFGSAMLWFFLEAVRVNLVSDKQKKCVKAMF